VAGVSVTFGDATAPNAPIFNVSNYNGTQSVTVQVPVETPVGDDVPVTITGVTGSTTVTANILQAALGVFDTGDALDDGRRMALVIRADGSVVSAANPIAPGETGRAFVTGLIPPEGLTTNAQLPIDSDIEITTPVIVGINNAGAPVLSVKYARNLVGVWEVQFQVRANTPSGTNIPFVVAIPINGKLVYSQASDIAIQ
jgi:uncharacterized protein (TIGR03437 family)